MAFLQQFCSLEIISMFSLQQKIIHFTETFEAPKTAQIKMSWIVAEELALDALVETILLVEI